MISAFSQIQDFFEKLDTQVEKKVRIFVIGGAALLKRGLKPVTKDIDIVVSTRTEFLEIQNALVWMGFSTKLPSKEYSHFNLSQIFIKDEFRIDIFESKVCSGFSVSSSMIRRSEEVLSLKNITVSLCSNEDILLFKTMTDREGDLNDCISIATTKNPNWSIFLAELKSQIKDSMQDVWITWVGERLDILVERGLDIPIMKDLNKLRYAYFQNFNKRYSNR